MSLFSRAIIFVISIFIWNSYALAQSNIADRNTGKLYVLWGWNFGYYSDSDIHFTGDNYDFVLDNVKGTDNQSPFSWDVYLNPLMMTVPQTNFRVGYYYKDNWNISLGFDHMKYFVTNLQTVKITGTIDQSGTIYDGVYNNEDIVIRPDFLHLEHSDGLNYINAEISYVKDILGWLGHPKEKMQVNVLGGFGAGILFPRTNAKLLGMPRNDYFNLAGYGLSIKAGINITFFKYFFVQSELKGGFINMSNINISPDKSDNASQSFFFVQPNVLFGGIFRIAKK